MWRNRWAVPKWQRLTWPGLVQDHLRKTSIVNRQLQFPPVSSRVRANCLMENTTTSSSIRRELQWRKVDLDKKLYGYVFLCLIRFLNRWPEFLVGLEKSPRPILQDQESKTKTKTESRETKTKTTGLKTKTETKTRTITLPQTWKPSATRTCFSCMLMMPTSSFLKNPRVQFTCL
mgnify:FL=1